MEFLYNLIIKPIYILLEILFNYIYENSHNYGLTFFLISLFISVICLPLYLKADELQEEERIIQAKLKDKIKNIKKYYKGDERQLLLQTYYKQNNYHPIMGLRLSLSLLLQIPIFCAAYTFFNDLPQLAGVSLGAIYDLSQPDGIFSIAGITINVYPIAMTMVNILAGYIYTKGKNFKENAILISISLIFLVLLYNSPAGLVLYWLYNNLFSLIKNICLKYITREKLIKYTFIMTFIVYCLLQKSFGKSIDVVLFAVLIFIIFNKDKIKNIIEKSVSYKKIFFLSMLSVFLLIGIYVPSKVIASSPLEFVFKDSSPFLILAYSATVYAGIFLFWGAWIFYFAEEKIKKYLSFTSLFLLMYFLTNFLMIKMPNFSVTNTFVFESTSINVNFHHYLCSPLIYLITICALLGIIFFILLYKKENIFCKFGIISTITLFLLTIPNYYKIINVLDSAKVNTNKEYFLGIKYIHLSKTKKNVLILFLDRFINSYLPIIFEEFPELSKQFEGFIYYPNTLSYSQHTMIGYLPILGGYEYTPHRMDEREGLFEEKYKQAITVLPIIFSKHNWNVSIINPTDAGWKKCVKWGSLAKTDQSFLSSDLLYKKYNISHEEIPDTIYSIMSAKIDLQDDNISKTNLIYYNFLSVLSPAQRTFIYNKGRYYTVKKGGKQKYFPGFLKNYFELEMLKDITDFSSDKNTFTVFNNALPHYPVLLSYPNYNLDKDNNKAYMPKLKPYLDTYSLIHYHVDVASLRFLGKYFDYLRENGVYDNTRIIVVADHGHPVKNNTFSEFLINNFSPYNPLLLVKDFNSNTPFITDTQLMTNGDIPVISTNKLIMNPINPYTGHVLSSNEKYNGILIKTNFSWDPKYLIHKKELLTNDDKFNYIKENPYKDKNWKINLTKPQAHKLIYGD